VSSSNWRSWATELNELGVEMIRCLWAKTDLYELKAKVLP
jgi:hypothetical protein